MLASVVVICAVIAVAGVWATNRSGTVRFYLWKVCDSEVPGREKCGSYSDVNDEEARHDLIQVRIVLILQLVSVVLSFIAAIVASVAGCMSQPKAALAASILLQVLYLSIGIAAWAFAVSVFSAFQIAWSYGFALAITGTILSLAVIGLSAAGIKQATPHGDYGSGDIGSKAGAGKEHP